MNNFENLENYIKENLGWKKFSISAREQLLEKRRQYWGDELKGVILLYNRKQIKWEDLQKIADECNLECFIQQGHGIWNSLTHYAEKKAWIIWLVEINNED